MPNNLYRYNTWQVPPGSIGNDGELSSGPLNIEKGYELMEHTVTIKIIDKENAIIIGMVKSID